MLWMERKHNGDDKNQRKKSAQSKEIEMTTRR